MRKKISIGFISLAIVLLFAGAISMYELGRLRNQAQTVIEQNSRNVRLTENMFSALQAQNKAIIEMDLTEAGLPGQDYYSGCEEFDRSLAEARTTASPADLAELDAIESAARAYRTVIDDRITAGPQERAEWFRTTYLASYYRLDEAIESYLISPSNSVSARAAMLEDDVYKTITPSILTMLVAIVIVLMFYYFVDRYYVRPLEGIHKSLDNYLKHNIPFNPKFESNDDELIGMKNLIGELIERKKSGVR